MTPAMGTGPVGRSTHGGTMDGVVVTGATGGIGSAVVDALDLPRDAQAGEITLRPGPRGFR
ncbi:hypothetical protein AB0I72_14885 [Nocardiopsis sp. NPDC049922]|uniref:hypothetical protein n=1 Tax=Nocardiopsis sp. NPDC049922 TaxID=3155157 RepID=UPI0033E7A8F7